MKILVTGGAGFIGHHLIESLLVETDWDIVCVDRLDYSGNLNRLHEVLSHYSEQDRRRVSFVFHDLRAPINPQVRKAIGTVQYIVHLAAGSHVDRSIEYPLDFVMDNVVGTAHLLEYARTCTDLDLLVYFSTDEIFGPADALTAFRENDRYNSTNPYSATKAGGEELVVAYVNTYHVPAIVTHTMNVFGPRQHPEKYIPSCIRKIRDGETIAVHANPSKTKAGSRHYIHASDVASAVLFLLRFNRSELLRQPSATLCQKFNIVGSQEIDNLELAQIIAHIQQKPLCYELIDYHTARPGHDLRYALDGSKMRNMGWQPAPIHDRLIHTVQWSLLHHRWLEI